MVKEPLNPIDTNFCLYKIDFNDCDSIYIGQTKHTLKSRIGAHRANYKLSTEKHSVILKHVRLFNHDFNWSNENMLNIVITLVYIRYDKH